MRTLIADKKDNESIHTFCEWLGSGFWKRLSSWLITRITFSWYSRSRLLKATWKIIQCFRYLCTTLLWLILSVWWLSCEDSWPRKKAKFEAMYISRFKLEKLMYNILSLIIWIIKLWLISINFILLNDVLCYLISTLMQYTFLGARGRRHNGLRWSLDETSFRSDTGLQYEAA